MLWVRLLVMPSEMSWWPWAAQLRLPGYHPGCVLLLWPLQAVRQLDHLACTALGDCPHPCSIRQVGLQPRRFLWPFTSPWTKCKFECMRGVDPWSPWPEERSCLTPRRPSRRWLRWYERPLRPSWPSPWPHHVPSQPSQAPLTEATALQSNHRSTTIVQESTGLHHNLAQPNQLHFIILDSCSWGWYRHCCSGASSW